MRGNKPRPIHDEMRTQSAQVFSRAGFSDPSLILRWQEIAGEDTARIASPIRFVEGPQGGILTLKAEPGAALFLQHESRALIARLNAFLGRAAVTKIRFVQAPLIRRPQRSAKPKPAPTLPLPEKDPASEFQGPEAVREALLRLARARNRSSGR